MSETEREKKLSKKDKKKNKLKRKKASFHLVKV